MNYKAPLAAIFGCSGQVLHPSEASFFKETNPLGFILFARNCESPEQVRRLTAQLRACVNRVDAPILMDHEGGRVQRLPTASWRKIQPSATFGKLAERNMSWALEAVNLNGRLMAAELIDLGINVNCVPCLDIQHPKAHMVIGDRSFSNNPDLVINLGRAQVEGLKAGGVLPIIKHIPGHGRALVDSHNELPIISAKLDEMANHDFKPFIALADLPIAMTAHVLYTNLDPLNPATTSPSIIERFIREQIGFNGLLITDDISMHALDGSISIRVVNAINAGCDVVLHCNGNFQEMATIANVCRCLSLRAQKRWDLALAWQSPPETIKYDTVLKRFHQIMDKI